MRVVKLVLGLGVVALALPALAGGCSTNATTPSTGPTGSCVPTGTCATVKSECLALVDNSSKMTGIGLRMSQLTLTKPAALLSPAVKMLIANAVLPALPDCNVNGQGTFNWLLQFDFTSGKLTTGGAKPVTDPHKGYCFVDEMKNGVQLAPVMLDGLKGPGSFDVTMPADLNVPIYLDATAVSVVILPLKKTRLTGTVLSTDESCIGSYNGAEFTTQNLCYPDSTTSPPQEYYTDGGSLSGYITLAQADTIAITSTNESLCALLSQIPSPDPHTFFTCAIAAMNNMPVKGDWCDATDAAATADCSDAFQLGATFAAAGIQINTTCP